MVISSLMAAPSGFPNFSSFRRSLAVTVIRFGSLLRRMRFSSFRFCGLWSDNPLKGAPENHIEYDSFGNITGETNSAVDLTAGYTGREWDADLQMLKLRERSVRLDS
jgi:hypothetical protein